MRIVIVVLILIAALFVVVLIVGAHNNSSQQAPTDSQGRREFAKNFSPQEYGLAGIGQLVARFSPKLKLERNTFTFAGPLLEPVPSSTDEFRAATFHVMRGCKPVPKENGGFTQDCSAVHIMYDSAGGDDGKLHLNHQDWEGKHDDPTRGSLVILKGGGTLTFTCVGMPSCTVILE
jgi:hypothetical protein